MKLSLTSLSHLRARLVLMALIAVLPALAVTAYTQAIERRNVRTQTIENALQVARLAASREALVFDRARQVLQTLALLPALHSSDSRTCGERLREILRDYPGYIAFGVVNLDGSTFCSSSGIKGQNRERPWFQHAVQTGTTAVGVYQVSPLNGKPDIAVAHPLFGSSGALERVIFAAVELDQLQRLISALKLPHGVRLTVFDRDRRILVRYPDSAQWVGKVFPDSPMVRPIVPGASEEVRDGVGVDGVRRLYATVPIQASLDTGLSVAIRIDRAVAFAEADRLLHQQLWLLSLLSLVAIGVAWIGGNALVLRPIKRLKSLTQRLAVGDFSVRAQLTGGAPELHELGDAIDSMVTALETRERERQQSEVRYREMFMNALTGAWVATPAGRLIACNPVFASMFGFASVEDALRLDLPSIYTRPGDREAFLDQLLAERRIENREIEFRRPDGKSLHAVQNVVGIVDDSGDLVEIRGYLIDTTQQKDLEAQLRQANKMEAVGQLAGGIAHDFNNILTVIIGVSEFMLSRFKPGTPDHADVEEILKAGKRAADLTRQLLAFSRRQIVQPVVLDVNVVVAGMDTLVRRLVGEHLDFVTVRTAGQTRVKMDQGQLEQVITNLVVNARDAMPDGGTLTVEISVVQLDELGGGRYAFRPGRYVRLAVSDTGTGIDPDTQARIFEPFFTTKETGKGTGLGLATVYGIVKQADGFIDLHSEPGSTTFKIYLPVTDEPLRAVEGAPPPIRPVLRDLVILVVEDDPAVRALIRKTLTAEGCRILEAGNGKEALGLLEQGGTPVDLVLTDVVMPGMGGRSLADHVGQLYPELKILFMSGYPSTMVATHGVLNSEVCFLEKPFSPDVLNAKVSEMLTWAPRIGIA